MLEKYVSTGILRYDPRHDKTRHDDWWLIVECGRGLVLTYKWLLGRDGRKIVSSDSIFNMNKSYPITKIGVTVSESAWKSHISVVRGERPRNTAAWNKYNGKKIRFEYSPMIESNDAHYWLPVKSKELDNIREELGLPKVSGSYNPNNPEGYVNQNGIWTKRPAQFHLTIGKDVN